MKFRLSRVSKFQSQSRLRGQTIIIRGSPTFRTLNCDHQSVLILAEIALGLYVSIKVAFFQLLSEIAEQGFNLIGGLYNILALVCDIIATVSLCIILRTSRTGFKSTNEVLNSLFRNFIGRGVLLVIVQGLFVILWFTEKFTLIWLPIYVITGKLYVTTLIALQNLRLRNRENFRDETTLVTFETHSRGRFAKNASRV